MKNIFTCYKIKITFYKYLLELQKTPFVIKHHIIFFLFTVVMLNAKTEEEKSTTTVIIPAELSKAKKIQLNSIIEPLIISIDMDGKTYFQEIEMSLAEIQKKLLATSGEKNNTKIYIRGNKKASYEKIMEIISEIGAIGFSRIFFIAEISTQNQQFYEIENKLTQKVSKKRMKTKNIEKIDNLLNKLLDEEDSDQQKELDDLMSNSLTLNEIDTVRKAISKCWVLDLNLQNASNIIVDIKLNLAPDGKIAQVDIIDKERFEKDSDFRVIAENIKRSLLDPKCSPLPFPINKYEKWQSIVLKFNPTDMGCFAKSGRKRQ